MIWRRLLLVVCALCCLGGAAAQTVPEIGRRVLWDLVYPSIENIPAGSFIAMFEDAPAPSTIGSNYAYVATFDIMGTTYTARVKAGNALYAWSYGASQGFGGDSSFGCFIVGRCLGAYKIEPNDLTTADNDYTFTISDTFGKTGANFSVINTGGTQPRFYPNISGGTFGVMRGGGNIFGSSPFNSSSCSGGWTGSGQQVETSAAAYSQITSKLSGIAQRWASLAPQCVKFVDFLAQTSVLPSAWSYGLADGKRRNLDPLRFFEVEGITVTDDTPSQDELQDSDGDGIRDADDPNPYGQQDADGDGTPDRYDPTPNGETPDNQWDVAPGDAETQCQIINIPCNLRKLFIPQVDWATEWQEMRDVMGQRLPFAYISWLGSGSSSASSQDIGIDLCAPLQYESLTMDWCNSGVMVWWRQYGVAIAFASLYIGYLFNVIVRIRA